MDMTASSTEETARPARRDSVSVRVSLTLSITRAPLTSYLGVPVRVDLPARGCPPHPESVAP